ncbi:hypothetical protein [Tanapox virus]|uniref:Uncharacterized protein 28.5L n=1 Tax=Tanapox virus TaxID=99000 RepID=A7XCE0_9POXV|nr:hypothetical protein [Tanapox virus]ABQ43657.1 hypothetical protein [Tanapox virus]
MQLESTLLVIAIIMMLLGIGSIIIETVVFINAYFVKKSYKYKKNEIEPLLDKTKYEK